MTTHTSITKIDDMVQSSSYIGFTTRNTDDSTITNLKAVKNGDGTLGEHVHHTPYIGAHPTHPSSTTPVPVEHHLITSRLPRHGEKISSGQILPPYLLYSAFGDYVMESTGDMGPNDKGFMFKEAEDMDTLVRKRSRIFQTECYHHYVTGAGIANAPDTAIVTALKNFISGYKNQTIQYSAASEGSHSVTENFYMRRTPETHEFVIASGASGTILIYAEKGSCTVSFAAGVPDDLNLVVICGDGSISVNSPGITRKLLLIGKAAINITDGTNNVTLTNNVTVVNSDTIQKGNTTSYSLPDHNTFGITSRHGIQKIHDTEMYEFESVFHNFEDAEDTKYKMIKLMGDTSIDDESHIELIAKQFQYQYGVTCTVNEEKRMIKSTFWGDHHVYTAVARQLMVDKIQSLNVISEVFNTGNYHETMAETFRVNEYAYAFAMPGKYMTYDARGDIVFGTNDAELFTQVEYRSSEDGSPITETVTIPDVLAVNAITTSDPNGGSDPIYMGMSKYRKLAVVPSELRTESVFIGSSSQSLVKYQPVGGKVISVSIPDDKISTGNVFLRDYQLTSTGLHLRNKYPSKTTGYTLMAKVKKTTKAGAVLQHRVNAMEYHRADEGVDVVYQDKDELIIRIKHDIVELKHLLVNGEATKDKNNVEYKYVKTTVDGSEVYELRHRIGEEFERLTLIEHAMGDQAEEDVKLFVMFPSLLLTSESNIADKVTNTSDVILPYVAMNTNGDIQCVLTGFGVPSLEGPNFPPLTKSYAIGHDMFDISNLPYELYNHTPLGDLISVIYTRTAQNILIRKNNMPFPAEFGSEDTGRCPFIFLGRQEHGARVTDDKIQYFPSGSYPEQQINVHKLNKINGFLEDFIITVDTAGKITYNSFNFVSDYSVNSVRFTDGGRRYEHTTTELTTHVLPLIEHGFETIVKHHEGLIITLAVEHDGRLKIRNIEKEDPSSTLPAILTMIIDDVPHHFIIHDTITVQ